MRPEYVPKFPGCSGVGPNQADWFLPQPGVLLAQPDWLAATSADRVDHPVLLHRANSNRDTRSLHGFTGTPAEIALSCCSAEFGWGADGLDIGGSDGLDTGGSDGLKPGFHGVRTPWIWGFIAFQPAGPARIAMLMVPA